MRGHPWALAVCAALATVSSVPVEAQSGSAAQPATRLEIAAHVREASQRFRIPEHWIHAVIRFESAGRTRAVSRAGAMGLMQLMPGTWERQRARFALGSDPFDPRDNILAGTSYLREMYDRYGIEGFLAAYNAGPGRYEQWRDRGRWLPRETRRYVARIAPLLQRDSMIFAAALQADGDTAAATPASSGPPGGPADQQGREPSASPFARPAHDLFASVSTSRHP